MTFFPGKNTGPFKPPSGKPGSGNPTIPLPGGRNPSPQLPTTPGSATIWPNALTVERIPLRLTAMRNFPYVLESPYYLIEGSSITWSITFDGATTVATPVATAYKDETAVTSTIFPTNTPTASGNVVTLSAATGFLGGERYVIVLSAVVDGATLLVKLLVIVASPGQE